MDIKTVGLDRDAYELLRRAKKKGESFSDVVKRLAAPRRPLSEFAGLWKDAPKKDLEAFELWRRASRKLDLARMDKLIRTMEEP
jgi:predicted CopG family antitoxin